MTSIADRIQEALDMRGMKQSDLAERTGIGKSSISTYLTGEYEPKQRNLYKMAEVLDVNPSWLMGLDVPIDLTTPPIPTSLRGRADIFPIKRKKVPMLGKIAAGVPIFADEDYDTFVTCESDVKCDFALQICGDSMINAGIHDGDVVFIRKQPDVNDGEIAAVIIDDSATLKRVHKIPGGVQLISENPKYKPMYFTAENSDSIRIIGKAVAFQHML